MRQRTSAYTPSPSSKVIELPEGRSVRLLPGSVIANASWGRKPIKERLEAANKASGADAGSPQIGMMVLALTLFMVWDDPSIEWAAQLDADALLEGSDDDLLAGSLLLVREMLSVSTAKLFRLEDLVEAHHVALTGKRPGQESDPEPGK